MCIADSRVVYSRSIHISWAITDQTSLSDKGVDSNKEQDKITEHSEMLGRSKMNESEIWIKGSNVAIGYELTKPSSQQHDHHKHNLLYNRHITPFCFLRYINFVNVVNYTHNESII